MKTSITNIYFEKPQSWWHINNGKISHKISWYITGWISQHENSLPTGQKNVHYNLYLIKNIRRYITQDAGKMLLCPLVLSQLDYLNSVLTDLPKATLRPYNYIQRYAARLACNKTKRDSAQEKVLPWMHLSIREKLMGTVDLPLQLHNIGTIYLNTSD